MPKLAAVPTPETRPAPIDWARARGAISATSSRDRQDRPPRQTERDRRATTELRRLARDIERLDDAEVRARLAAIGADFGVKS